MNKKSSGKAKKKALVKKEISDILCSTFTPLTASSQNGEHTVEFNKYIVVYSNNFSGNLQSSWRAGETSISCYKDDQFVGVIDFYKTNETMNGGYVAGNGVVVIEYPIAKFEDVMRILKTFNNLYLLFVERNYQGVPLSHRIGAIMTFAKKPIGQ